jgi:hypothetical protein
MKWKRHAARGARTPKRQWTTSGTNSPGSISGGRARGRALRILRWSMQRRPGRLRERSTVVGLRGSVRRAVGRRVPALPAKPARVREGIRLREENTAADRIAVCSLEKKLSRRP